MNELLILPVYIVTTSFCVKILKCCVRYTNIVYLTDFHNARAAKQKGFP